MGSLMKNCVMLAKAEVDIGRGQNASTISRLKENYFKMLQSL